mmetsp:Transcript_9461/g.30224  ORF Transcript_9461/g.30224 Transcript_9461/m.30224 type:complete len:227 (-) Transcript_9461:214-894(-)
MARPTAHDLISSVTHEAVETATEPNACRSSALSSGVAVIARRPRIASRRFSAAYLSTSRARSRSVSSMQKNSPAASPLETSDGPVMSRSCRIAYRLADTLDDVSRAARTKAVTSLGSLFQCSSFARSVAGSDSVASSSSFAVDGAFVGASFLLFPFGGGRVSPPPPPPPPRDDDDLSRSQFSVDSGTADLSSSSASATSSLLIAATRAAFASRVASSMLDARGSLR